MTSSALTSVNLLPDPAISTNDRLRDLRSLHERIEPELTERRPHELALPRTFDKFLSLASPTSAKSASGSYLFHSVIPAHSQLAPATITSSTLDCASCIRSRCPPPAVNRRVSPHPAHPPRNPLLLLPSFHPFAGPPVLPLVRHPLHLRRRPHPMGTSTTRQPTSWPWRKRRNWSEVTRSLRRPG